MTIDGYTQPGAVGNWLAVGSNAVFADRTGWRGAGLRRRASLRRGDGSTVRGLVVNRFSADGITLGSQRQGRRDPGEHHRPGRKRDCGHEGNAFVGVRTANAVVLIGGTDPEIHNVIFGEPGRHPPGQ